MTLKSLCSLGALFPDFTVRGLDEVKLKFPPTGTSQGVSDPEAETPQLPMAS